MTTNWWANKLGTTPAAPTQQPVYAPQSTPPTYQPPAYQPPELQERRLPQSAKVAQSCPGCGSGNYGQTSPEHKARCYDCGYPLTQAGSGVSGVGSQSQGPTRPAPQVPTGGFNPTTIIGHI